VFKSLHDSWTDTTTPHGRLMLTVLGGLAEFERELILARTGDGRARAKGAACDSDGRVLSQPTKGRKHCKGSPRAKHKPIWHAATA